MPRSVFVAVLLVLAPDAPADDREALKPLAEKALKAAGGEKLRAVKAWTVTQRYTAAGTTIVSRLYFQPPERFRSEDESTEAGKLVRSVMVINGDQGWWVEQGKTRDMGAREAAFVKQAALPHAAPVLAPAWLSHPNSVLTKLPGVKVGDREAAAVQVSRKGAGTVQLSFDTETGRLLKVKMEQKLPNGADTVTELVFGDFRAVGGFVLPHQKAHQSGGKVSPPWVVTEYKFADALDAKLFEKPVTTDDVKRPAFVTAFLAVKREVDAREDKLFFAFEEGRDGLESEAEREAAFLLVVRQTAKLRAPAAEKVLAAVRPHAADPAARDALVWVVSKSHGTAPGNEAAELLMKHHLTRAQTIDLAYEHKEAPLRWTEPMLRAQLAAAGLPKGDRPRVLFALAWVKKTHSELPSLLARATDNELAQLEWHYGKGLVADFRKLDAARAEAEAVRLFTDLGKKHGSEKAVRDVTFGDLAKAALFEVRHLSVGKPAPETAGEDTDGVKLQLSDYRGTVVMLSFWGTWCRPCMQLVPHEREIVERLRGKPFALVGVNSDTDRTKVKAAMARAGITWRSFWCGEKGTDGDIPSLWNVRGWPTVYVLDHKGVIRAKNVTGTALDRILDKLVAEVGVKK
jgi:thiol-disulfide isomerase/thioredoxin